MKGSPAGGASILRVMILIAGAFLILFGGGCMVLFLFGGGGEFSDAPTVIMLSAIPLLLGGGAIYLGIYWNKGKSDS